MTSTVLSVALEPRSVALPAAIEIRGLVKRFGRVDVLRGIDVEIASGRVTAVVGPNGAGKTTLIKSIIGLAHPNAGSIRVAGVLVADGDDYRARIGYMPQIARFPYNLTGSELLGMLKDLRRGSAPASEVDEQLVTLFQLGGELAKPLRALSGGTRQKVNAVAAFLFRPELLILDEPTAGLDPLSSGVLKDKILAERRDGHTVIVTSHIMSDLQELADDVIVLLDGGVRYAGTVQGLLDDTSEHTLERAVARLMLADGARS